MEGDSDDLEGGDSEQSNEIENDENGSLAEVPLDDVKANKSKSSFLGFVSKMGKSVYKRNADDKDRKRITVQKESKTQYFEDGSWQEIVLSLSWGHVYEGIK